jgi:hypothetical protein
MNLTYQVGETLFLDRGVFLEVDVPVTLTPTTAFSTVPIDTTYLADAGSFKEIAFRQYGILSCVDQLTVNFNSATVAAVNNLQRSFEMTSEYYNGALVDKFFLHHNLTASFHTNITTVKVHVLSEPWMKTVKLFQWQFLQFLRKMSLPAGIPTSTTVVVPHFDLFLLLLPVYPSW